jgi:threonylcarbamoyladenosine tRNA methylthiotransferase MtaB
MQAAYGREWVGKVLDVIPEREAKGAEGTGLVSGYTDNYIQVVFNGDPSLIGKLCRVRITDSSVNECQGALLEVLEADSLPVAMQA